MKKRIHGKKQVTPFGDVYVQRSIVPTDPAVDALAVVNEKLGQKIDIFDVNQITLMLFKASKLPEFRQKITTDHDLETLNEAINSSPIVQPQIDLSIFKESRDRKGKSLFVIPQRNLLCLALENNDNSLDFAVHQAVGSLEQILGSRIESDHKGHVATHERGYERNSLQDYVVLGEVSPRIGIDPTEYRTIINNPKLFCETEGIDFGVILPETVCFGAMKLVEINQRRSYSYS